MALRESDVQLAGNGSHFLISTAMLPTHHHRAGGIADARIVTELVANSSLRRAELRELGTVCGVLAPVFWHIFGMKTGHCAGLLVLSGCRLCKLRAVNPAPRTTSTSGNFSVISC